MKPQYESYSDYYQTEHELKINNMNEDKVLNQRKEITLPDTLESLVAQLSIKAMQSVDIEACKKGEAFFNDEEFEEIADNLMRSFCQRLLERAVENAKIECGDIYSDYKENTDTNKIDFQRFGNGRDGDMDVWIDKESIINTEI